MADIQVFSVEIEGLCPLLLHSGDLCDPFNYYAKELKKVSSKRNKTEDDQRQMMRIEWDGGLYLDDKGRVAMPADNILALVQGGARKFKLGKQVAPGVFTDKDNFAVDYDGPKDLDKLFNDPRFVLRKRVKVGQASIMRTRPRFPKWSLKFDLEVVTDLINPEDLRRILDAAGRVVGLGDWRPRYGRFIVTKFEAA